MPAELTTVGWPTVFVTVSIVLAVVLVVRRKNLKTSSIAGGDSVQYIFTATVKARHPGVTYLDFPAPPPPNCDHEAVGYGPTILRTFGRTLTKLRFSNKVEVKPVSDDAPSNVSRQRHNNRAAMLQIMPIRNVSSSIEGTSLHADVLVASHSSSHEEPTVNVVPTTKALRREPTPGPSISHRKPILGSIREPTPGPSTIHRHATPGPCTIRRDSVRGGSVTDPSANACLPSSNSDGEPSDPVTGPRSSTSTSNIDDAMPQLVRNKRFSGKVGDGPDAVRVLMFWWEMTSPERIHTLPDLSRRQEL
ncbi:hypothetical protein GSI_10968 [Ganoderma sinense ZZ0214-1]|uniref:Uncharacterized protein n=1 Tax=Ganoderma sinense ZZ0214-1 TaxID=1077348 RepID=A0A2G8S241_9APHY|nr:hypothetical protein GSI_10968 [Ganoderma sinense ZZ0214-1]